MANIKYYYDLIIILDNKQFKYYDTLKLSSRNDEKRFLIENYNELKNEDYEIFFKNEHSKKDFD